MLKQTVNRCTGIWGLHYQEWKSANDQDKIEGNADLFFVDIYSVITIELVPDGESINPKHDWEFLIKLMNRVLKNYRVSGKTIHRYQDNEPVYIALYIKEFHQKREELWEELILNL